MSARSSASRGAARCKLTGRLVLACSAILLVFASAEIALRLMSETPWYERLPGAQRGTPPVVFDVGGRSYPLRQPPLHLPKLKEGRRLLFLGDSFTYGSGVAERSTFVSLVTQGLNESSRRHGGPFYESFNGGIPGSMTDDWVRLFDAMAAEYRPDCVVTVFFLRDGVAGVTSMGQINAIGSEMRTLAERSFGFRHSRLYRFFAEREAQRRLSRDYLAGLQRGYTGDVQSTHEWRRAQDNLREIRASSERLGARFGLVIFPVLFELTEDYPLSAVVDEIVRFAASENMRTLSLLPIFTGRSDAGLWVSPLNQHPNEQAHRIAADAILRFVSDGLCDGAAMK